LKINSLNYIYKSQNKNTQDISQMTRKTEIRRLKQLFTFEKFFYAIHLVSPGKMRITSAQGLSIEKRHQQISIWYFQRAVPPEKNTPLLSFNIHVKPKASTFFFIYVKWARRFRFQPFCAFHLPAAIFRTCRFCTLPSECGNRD